MGLRCALCRVVPRAGFPPRTREGLSKVTDGWGPGNGPEGDMRGDIGATDQQPQPQLGLRVLAT